MRAVGAALGVVVCVSGGCAIERTTAVESVDSGTTNDENAGSSSSGSSSGGDGGFAGSLCSNDAAAFTIMGPNGQANSGGYFIRADAWNTDAGPGPETIYACSYSSWNVVANEPSTLAVKAYPDVQMDFQASGAVDGTGVPISSFTSITSTFAETSPHVGVYDDAYDIFVNSNTLVGPGTTEIMIWVENYGQPFAGSKVASAVSLGNRTYDVYFEADNGNGGHYIAFVANVDFTSGTVDILSFLDYAIQQSWIPATAPLNQICFGVEISETSGGTSTFEFTDFSITAR